MTTATYSFLDISAAIDGPGGAFSMQGEADEGITIEYTDDKNTMTIGADGGGMHSLHAGRSGTVTVHALKRSILNSQMQGMYTFQTGSSANHGQNTFSLNDPISGDNYICQQGAFKKFPNNTFAKDGNTLDWTFDFIVIIPTLGGL